jgi:hypothetical protein
MLRRRGRNHMRLSIRLRLRQALTTADGCLRIGWCSEIQYTASEGSGFRPHPRPHSRAARLPVAGAAWKPPRKDRSNAARIQSPSMRTARSSRLCASLSRSRRGLYAQACDRATAKQDRIPEAQTPMVWNEDLKAISFSVNGDVWIKVRIDGREG